MPHVAGELFTWTSLGTFTGLTGATVFVTNAISRAANWNPAWFGLVVALVLCLGFAAAAASPVMDYILAVLNACVVYVSAAGTNSVGAAATATGGGRPEGIGAGDQRPFFRPWL
jgi:hypothetical protein